MSPALLECRTAMLAVVACRGAPSVFAALQFISSSVVSWSGSTLQFAPEALRSDYELASISVVQQFIRMCRMLTREFEALLRFVLQLLRMAGLCSLLQKHCNRTAARDNMLEIAHLGETVTCKQHAWLQGWKLIP